MGRIKLGISLKSLGQPFRRSLPAAQALGVAGIELEALGELAPTNLTATGRREITHLLRSHDLAISAINCPLRRGIDVAVDLEPRLDYIRDAMTLAFDLGPRLIIIPIGKIAEKEDSPERNMLKEALLNLGKFGDRTGVIVALDLGGDDPAIAVDLLAKLDTGSLAVIYNPASLAVAGRNPHDALRALHRRVAMVHAQDARRISPNRMGAVPLGHGDIDWLQLAADFTEIDYRGWWTILADDRAEDKASVAFLQRVMP